MNSGYRAALRAKQFALCSPIEGQASVVHQPVRGELWRMPAVQDSRDNVGGEKGEPDETRKVRPDDPLLYGDLSQGSVTVTVPSWVVAPEAIIGPTITYLPLHQRLRWPSVACDRSIKSNVR
jgi:hypothetical protein